LPGVLPVVEGAIQAAKAIRITVGWQVTAVAMMAMEFASDAATHAGSTQMAAHVSTAEVAAHVSTAKAANTASAKSASVTPAKSAAVAAATTAAATRLRFACK
jgi:hypothetical protein